MPTDQVREALAGLSEYDRRALVAIVHITDTYRWGGATPASIGHEVWGPRDRQEDRRRKAQGYGRLGGRFARRLMDAGLAHRRFRYRGDSGVIVPTWLGRQVAMELANAEEV